MTESMQSTTLLMSEFVTHDIKRFIVTKPEGFSHQAGQAVELAINTAEWKDEGRPFTPTNLASDEVLEFIIKSYPDHDGVTEQLHKLKPNTELLISDVFGTISYSGPGVFIAAGAGITPFLSIFREQKVTGDLKGSRLIFSNKTQSDIVAEKELRHYFGDDCVFTCTQETPKDPSISYGRIDKDFLENNIQNFNQPFYVCGPPGFMDAVTNALKELGAEPDSLVFED